MSDILEDLKAKITAIHNDCNIGEGITEKVVSTVAEAVSALEAEGRTFIGTLEAEITELKATIEAQIKQDEKPAPDDQKEAAATEEVKAAEGEAGTVEGNPGESPAVDGEKSDTVTEAEGAAAG